MYDPYGNMAVQIMPDRERPKFAVNKATPEEAQAALLGYTAYFGTYSVDPVASTVTHHRQGNINPGGIGDYVCGALLATTSSATFDFDAKAVEGKT
jgi:hypothetical protein